jgi:hypothetical protein
LVRGRVQVELVARLGKKWSTIQGKLHRSADSCRDKYREMSDEYTKGRWKEQETEVLKRLIREQIGAEPGTSMRALGKLVEEQGVHVPWSTISKRMVKRSRLSCFKKWQKLTGLFSLSDDHRSKAELLEAIAEDIKGNSEEGRDAKRAKIENDPTASFPQAPTAGAAAALAVAAGSTGGNSFYELYDSAKMADETVEGKVVVTSRVHANTSFRQAPGLCPPPPAHSMDVSLCFAYSCGSPRTVTG